LIVDWCKKGSLKTEFEASGGLVGQVVFGALVVRSSDAALIARPAPSFVDQKVAA
jgi:hypothetical protein